MFTFFHIIFPFRKSSPHSSDKHSHNIPSIRQLCRTPVLLPATVLLLFSLLFIFFGKHPERFPLTQNSRFTAFTEEVFRNEMAGNSLNLHYMIKDPSAYQIDVSTPSLGSADLASRQALCAALENYRSKLTTFDRNKLSAKQQLTYDVFSHYLETELSASHLLLYDEPLSPTLGVQAQLPILLAEYTFRTRKDIEDYLCLLAQIPDYFSSILSFEQEKSKAGLFMNEACAEAVIEQCRAFIAEPEDHYLLTVFNDKMDRIANLTTDEKIAFKTRNHSILSGYVFPAYQNLINGLILLSNTGQNDNGLAYFPQGKEYYRYLIRSMVGDDREITVIENEIKTKILEDYAAIHELSKQPYSETSRPHSAPELLQELRQKITSDFPLLPNVSCEIKYVHESLQKYLSPAFYLIPPVDAPEHNVIYLNPASSCSGLELFTTLAHEGYPGHLYQSVYFQSTEPDLLRLILDTGGYTEGWGTYAELHCTSLWDGDPVEAELARYNRSFTLGLASLLDIGVHYHGYTQEEVFSFLAKLGFDQSAASSLYQSILHTPANYLQYYVGYLNFLRLRNTQIEQKKELFSLKEFHRTVLDAGPMPFSLLEQFLQENS